MPPFIVLLICLWMLQLTFLTYLAWKTSPLNFGVLGSLSSLLGSINLILLTDLGFVDIPLAITYMLGGVAGTAAYVLTCKPIRAPDAAAWRNAIPNIPWWLTVGYWVHIACYAYIDYVTWSEFGWGGARVIAAKENLILTNLQHLSEGLAAVTVVSDLTRRRYLKFLMLLLVGFFSGSKGGAANALVEIFFFYLILMGRYPIKLGYVMVAALVVVVGQFLFLNEDLDILLSVNALAMYRGDIYSLLFVDGFKANLQGLYDPIPYIFHHFLRLIGLRGYDAPLGTALFAFKQEVPLSEAAGGATAPIFIYFDIFTGGVKPVIVIGCVLLGWLAGRMYNWGVRHIEGIKLRFVDVLAGFWFMQSWVLLTDFGVFSYRLTPVFVLIIWKIFARLVHVPLQSSK